MQLHGKNAWWPKTSSEVDQIAVKSGQPQTEINLLTVHTFKLIRLVSREQWIQWVSNSDAGQKYWSIAVFCPLQISSIKWDVKPYTFVGFNVPPDTK